MKKRPSKINAVTIVYMIMALTGMILMTRCEHPTESAAPELILSTVRDTTVRAGDDFVLGVDVVNGSYWGMYFIWEVDTYIDTSKEFKKTFSWAFSDTGVHTIIVSALNQRMVAAQPETLNVTVKCSYPTIDAQQSDTSILWGDTLRIKPVVRDADGSVTTIRWKTDLDTLWYSTAVAGRFFTWGRLQTGNHLICIRAVDDNNLLSTIDSVKVQVKSPSSKVEITGNDTTVQLLEPLVVRAEVNGIAPVQYLYKWSVDTFNLFIGSADSVRLQFGRGQSGKHRVMVSVLGSDSSLWSSDTLMVTARYDRVQPSVNLMDSVVYVHDIVRCIPSFNCPLAYIDSIWFSIDGREMKKSVLVDTFKINFQISDTGSHAIVLHVLDTNGILSESEGVNITVMPGYPEVTFPPDTTISVNDTLRVTSIIKDVNGSVVISEYNNGGSRIDSNLFKVFYKGQNTVVLKAAVMDDDSLESSDSMVVHFNVSPELKIHSPFPDTLYCTVTNRSASAALYYSVFDKENDIIDIDVIIKKHGTDSSYGIKGTKDSVVIAASEPGLYYWNIRVKDSFGSITSVHDSFTVVMNHTICFVGHSIVSGMAGDGQNGGFRSTVLKGLRENLIPFHNIKAVGPLTTPDMSLYPEDDSCFAISGSRAYEMYFFLRSGYKTVTADMWVIMLGANSQYSTVELRNTILLLDVILARCPQSKVYILTSPPFPDIDEFWNGNYYRTFYNVGIYDSVAVRNSNGSHISVVDADTLLTDSLMQFDSTWFTDHVHPNMKGYFRVGEKILSVMRSKENPAMNADLYRKND
ncbi:MAG TPA: SGNH/GDSL hydrolase family protein [Chitinispirillaceae bacterium]|nr:SGNH/GDSL hydrolase family protein [Chitinispirillaceae bacterium]